jgi:terminase small subunit / prophage DNA-packing protein
MKNRIYDVDDDLFGDASALVETIPEAMNRIQLGALLGIGVRHVDDLADKGILEKVSRGRFAVRRSVTGYCAFLRNHAEQRSPTPTHAAEKLRYAKEQADKLALANAATRRELVPASEVESTWAGILRDVRAAMLSLPSRIQQRLPHLSATDTETIDREVRDTLTEAANDA